MTLDVKFPHMKVFLPPEQRYMNAQWKLSADNGILLLLLPAASFSSWRLAPALTETYFSLESIILDIKSLDCNLRCTVYGILYTISKSLNFPGKGIQIQNITSIQIFKVFKIMPTTGGWLEYSRYPKYWRPLLVAGRPNKWSLFWHHSPCWGSIHHGRKRKMNMVNIFDFPLRYFHPYSR